MNRSKIKRIALAASAVLLAVLIVAGTLFGGLFRTDGPVPQSPTSIPSVPEETGAPEPEESEIYDFDLLPSGPKVEAEIDLYKLNPVENTSVEHYRSAWDSLCDALREETTQFSFGSAEEKGVLLQAVSTLPHAGLFTVRGEGLGVEIEYAEDYSEQTDFLSAVAQSILQENVFADANPMERTLLLYTYLVTNVELTGNDAAFRVLTDYRGNHRAIASTLSFLLTQLDIPCTIAEASGDAALAVLINGQCWYFSPGEEIQTGNLRGLSYFCMNETRATDMFGRFPVPDLGQDPDRQEESFAQAFDGCTDWRLDMENHYLYLAYNNDSLFTTSVSTEEMSKTYG